MKIATKTIKSSDITYNPALDRFQGRVIFKEKLLAAEEFLKKEKTLRPGFDFRKGFGDASIQSFNLFDNKTVFENVALGIRRLSIVDLKHGNQPIIDKNKSLYALLLQVSNNVVKKRVACYRSHAFAPNHWRPR